MVTYLEGRKAGVGIVIFVVILLILLGIAAFVIIQSGAFQQAVDPCERQFQDCNHACGEGILKSICKEGCSVSYRDCKVG